MTWGWSDSDLPWRRIPESHHQRLVVLLEHRDADSATLNAASEYGQAIHEGLRAVNREFRRLNEIAADRTVVRVEIHGRNAGPFASERDSIKRHYVEPARVL